MPENKSANKLSDVLKDDISAEIHNDELMEYRFWCPTCNKVSTHFDTKDDFVLVNKAFNTIDPGQNACGHEGVELQQRAIKDQGFESVVGSSTPRVATAP